MQAGGFYPVQWALQPNHQGFQLNQQGFVQKRHQETSSITKASLHRLLSGALIQCCRLLTALYSLKTANAAKAPTAALPSAPEGYTPSSQSQMSCQVITGQTTSKSSMYT